jgi:signal transduction histidine kinase
VDATAADLLDLVGELAAVERRSETAAALARLLGGERLLIFAPDPELGVVLPAPGFPQVLRGAAGWRAFIEATARAGEFSGTVPGVDGPEPAYGCALADGTAAVLVRPAPGAPGPGLLRPLLPLLSAYHRAERQIMADEVRLRAAREAAERERALTRTLQQLRDRLEDAYAEADEARTHAKQRAEEAEALATELQAHAEQLQDQAVELEAINDELVARTAEAERARADAERARAEADEANRAKSSFLANMSHELRTPINAVIGYAELLEMEVAGPVTPEQQAQLERIRASSAHLLTLINDILDLAKVEAGHMSVKHDQERLGEVVGEALALVGLQAEAGALTLENQCRESRALYVGDRNRVRQIIVNLLSNALKFTTAGGRVTVRCGTTGRPSASAQLAGAGPWTYLSVEDTGIGIAADQLPRIFQPFIQAEEGHTRTRGGTGLGLTISRQLARLMGGDITVTSSEGSGSCFVLWLPAFRPETGSLDSTIRVSAGIPWRDAVRSPDAD